MGSSPLFAAPDLLFRRCNITTTVDELAIILRQDGNGAADYLMGSDNRQAAYKKWSSRQRSQPSANDASTQASEQARLQHYKLRYEPRYEQRTSNALLS